MIYINDVQLFVTFQRKSTKTQFWSDVTKISWTQKPCSYDEYLSEMRLIPPPPSLPPPGLWW